MKKEILKILDVFFKKSLFKVFILEIKSLLTDVSPSLLSLRDLEMD